ncbi:hypothetical protein J6590_009720 [Homalodisca vitripennis]|nr:hypothetical protein J6590_009720 [Homalodisca vitripennis]
MNTSEKIYHPCGIGVNRQCKWFTYPPSESQPSFHPSALPSPNSSNVWGWSVVVGTARLCLPVLSLRAVAHLRSLKQYPETLVHDSCELNSSPSRQVVFPKTDVNPLPLARHESARPPHSHCSLNGTDRHALLYLLELISAALE